MICVTCVFVLTMSPSWIIFLALGSLKALADIICEYPSIHKRYTVKCCGGGRGNVLILETFALIT